MIRHAVRIAIQNNRDVLTTNDFEMAINTIFKTVTLFVLTVLFTIDVPLTFFKVFMKDDDEDDKQPFYNVYYR